MRRLQPTKESPSRPEGESKPGETRSDENGVMGEVLSLHNLYGATRKCQRNVRWKDSVCHFSNHALANAWKLRKSLIDGTYAIAPYSRFTVSEPKTREITSTRFRDRVFQRSLCDNYVYREMTRSFIPNDFACQKGKGTDRARECLKRLMREHYAEHGTDGYVLKADVHDYFGSTRHDVAKRAVRERVADDWAYGHVARIIDSFDAHGDPTMGIGLGSQVSQLIQLAVLDGVDHLVTEKLGLRRYVRYMDDILVLTATREEAASALSAIREELGRIGLEISPRKTYVARITRPVTFLGFSFLLHEGGRVTVRLPKKAERNQRRRMRKLAERLSPEDFETCYNSWRAHAGKSDSRGRMLRMDRYKEELKMEYKSIKKQIAEATQAADRVDGITAGDNAVSAAVRGKGFSLYEENAILRKALRKVIRLLDAPEGTFAEFLAYDGAVEAAKAEAKAEKAE